MTTTKSWRRAKPIPTGRYRDRSALGEWLRAGLVGVLTSLCALVFSGCSTGKPASASFASVVITNQSLSTIQDTTMLVFGEAGYKANRVPDGTMVFEREGSNGDQILYGGLGGAAYGGTVTIRVRAEIVDLAGTEAHRLQCQAYFVRGAGDGVFEDKSRMANFRRGPYQKLLDEVAAKLK